MTIIALPKALRERLGEEGSKAFIDVLDQALMKTAEERFEMRLVKTEAHFDARFAEIDTRFAEIDTRFAKMEARFDARFAEIDTRFAKMEARINALSADFDTRLAKVRGELLVAIADSRSEIIKWMFIFWAGQVATLFAFLKLLK